jgi:hypothetical protein
MALIRSKRWWWEFFKALLFNLHTTIRGNVTLAYGRHEVEIPIDDDITPLSIYLNCFDMGTTVCVGDVSCVSAQLTDRNSFILHAHIESESADVVWLIEYEPSID